MAKNRNKNKFTKPEVTVLMNDILTNTKVVATTPKVDDVKVGFAPLASFPIDTDEDRVSTQQEIIRAKQALVTLSDYVEYGGVDPMSIGDPGVYEPDKEEGPVTEPIFGGFYKVTNVRMNGKTFIPGDNRRIPCSRIHLNLKQVEQLAMDGYTLQLLDEPVISQGYSRITKKNVHAFILKIKNMIEYGFITER